MHLRTPTLNSSQPKWFPQRGKAELLYLLIACRSLSCNYLKKDTLTASELQCVTSMIAHSHNIELFQK